MAEVITLGLERLDISTLIGALATSIMHNMESGHFALAEAEAKLSDSLHTRIWGIPEKRWVDIVALAAEARA